MFSNNFYLSSYFCILWQFIKIMTSRGPDFAIKIIKAHVHCVLLLHPYVSLIHTVFDYAFYLQPHKWFITAITSDLIHIFPLQWIYIKLYYVKTSSRTRRSGSLGWTAWVSIFCCFVFPHGDREGLRSQIVTLPGCFFFHFCLLSKQIKNIAVNDQSANLLTEHICSSCSYVTWMNGYPKCPLDKLWKHHY